MTAESRLTARCIVSGMVLGAVLSVSNLYVGLKIGLSFGVSITASVLSVAVWAGIARVVRLREAPSLLEHNLTQTCAGAAGYMPGTGLNSAIPALAMLAAAGLVPDARLSAVALMAWIVAISLLGVLTATALKRTMIDVEQLRFPSGEACAATLRSMQSTQGNVVREARALGLAAVAAAACKLFVSAGPGRRLVPSRLALPLRIGRYTMNDYSLGLPPSPLLIGAGALVGLRVGVSLAVGALLNYAVVGPWLVAHDVFRFFEAPAGATAAAARAALKVFEAAAARDGCVGVSSHEGLAAALRTRWSLWPGASLLVGANLVTLAWRWRTFARAFRGLMAQLKSKRAPVAHDGQPASGVDASAVHEVPRRWFWGAFVGVALACVVLQAALFGVRWWMGIVSVAAATVLGAVAARATGETDFVPSGPLGKVTQLAFSVIAPGDVTTNLMTANVTSGAAAHASELLTDLKTGHLLGSSARHQVIAQVFGVLAGACFCVPAYLFLVRGSILGGTELPAPAAAAWRGVAEFLANGSSHMPRYALAASIAAALLGGALSLAEEIRPALRKYLPSAMGMGIALVIDAQDSFAMFLGALAAYVVARKWPDWHKRYSVNIASGLIAGEGVMGVVVAALRVGGVLG